MPDYIAKPTEGFLPIKHKTTCIECKGIAELMEDWKNNGDRIYYCKRCKRVFASPTSYALCMRHGIIERDQTGFNSCVMYCEIYKKLKSKTVRTSIPLEGGEVTHDVTQCKFMINSAVPYEEVWGSEYRTIKGFKNWEV